MSTLISRLILAGCILAPTAQAANEATAASAPAAVDASAPAAATAPTPAPAAPSKEEAIKAIAILENHFTEPRAVNAANVLWQFVQASKDVSIQLSPKTAPWAFTEKAPASAGEAQLRDMLLAAYLAGNTKSQLAAGTRSDNPLAGWHFTLKCYKSFQKKYKMKLTELETLKAQQAKGQLATLAKKALQP